ncbi:unnamed protein product [Effrenium voratum]|nr:unnamed protein product [Effrenium voratum]
MHFVWSCIFLFAVGSATDSCAEEGPERQRSLLQQQVMSRKTDSKQEHRLQPGPRIKVMTGWTDQEPEEVQSTDESLCEEDVFARPELCPAKCPYAAEMRDEFCHFRCVKKDECGLLGTVENATIPDEDLMVCRHCNVEGCLHCVSAKPGQEGEKLEHCKQCMPGYSLTEEGECEMRGLGFFIAVGVVVVVATVLVIIWYAIVVSKPCVNPEGVEYGLQCRERMRLSVPGSSEAYPLTTNLLSTNVAGPGTMALFRYQFALLVWASTLLLVWFGFVVFVSSDLLILGNRAAESPQMLCAIIEWGHHRQMELVWTKVAWLAFAYVFSFVGAIFYGVQQTKLFATANHENATMTSFCAKLEGLPSFKGNERAEEKLKAAVLQSTGVQPEGVSVAWDFAEAKHKVDTVLEQEAEDGADGHADAPPEPETALGKAEVWATDQVLHAWHVHLEHHHVGTEEVKSLLNGMSSTPIAYVVFKSQEDKVKATRAGEVTVDGKSCKLKDCKYAPEGLFWHNMAVTPEQRSGKVLMALLGLVVSCAIWTFILYIPYAFYMASFSYANGDEPGEFSEGIFICLVVGSQIGLFVVSSMGAKYAAFHSEDETQKAYTVYYNAALILNLILDLALQTYLSYLQMVGVGAHTSDGRLLGDLDSFQQIFESYPVQKSMGKLLFVYCWPCTFFVPFLAEPFAVQWLPKHLGQYIVGADKRIKGENAEKALELGEMEQGRFATNQMSGGDTLGSGYLKGYALGGACIAAAALHFVVHLALLEFVVKPMGEAEVETKDSAKYADAAKICPATYFSTNPIHCLRSKYILNHSPPQVFYAPGKEHLAKTNPAIGAYYEFHGK